MTSQFAQFFGPHVNLLNNPAPAPAPAPVPAQAHPPVPAPILPLRFLKGRKGGRQTSY